MSRENLREKMELVLSMVPLSSAADTIRSFCLRYDKCSKECPFHNAHGKGCYFNNVTPDKWEIGEMIYKMTEEIGGKKARQSRRATKMKWERARIEYKGCKVFNDGYGGRLYSERDKNGEATRCCLGAYEGDPEWPEYCEACKLCKKFINNVRGDNV